MAVVVVLPDHSHFLLGEAQQAGGRLCSGVQRCTVAPKTQMVRSIRSEMKHDGILKSFFNIVARITCRHIPNSVFS